MRRRGFTLSRNSEGAPTPVPFNITTTSPLPNGHQDTAYELQLTTDSTNPPLHFTKISGNLPPGIYLTSTGSIEGIPTAVGTYVFRINAIDASSYTASAPFSLTIDTAPPVEHWRLKDGTPWGMGLSGPPGGYNVGNLVTPDIPLTGTAPVIIVTGTDGDGVVTSGAIVSTGDYPSNPGIGEWTCSGGDGSGALLNTLETTCWEQFTP